MYFLNNIISLNINVILEDHRGTFWKGIKCIIREFYEDKVICIAPEVSFFLFSFNIATLSFKKTRQCHTCSINEACWDRYNAYTLLVEYLNYNSLFQ